MIAVALVEGLALVLLGVLVVGLLRSHAEILRQLDDLGAGRGEPSHRDAHDVHIDLDVHRRGDVVTPADLQGELSDGSAAVVGVAGAGHDTLLAFLSGTCASCSPFWDALATRDLEVPGGARLVVVVQDHEDVDDLVARLPGDRVVIRSSAAWTDYAVPGAPHFVYVDGPGARVVGEGTGSTWRQVLSLVRQAESSRRSSRNRDELPEPGPVTPESNPERVDRELLAAGIGPGHPSLYEQVD